MTSKLEERNYGELNDPHLSRGIGGDCSRCGGAAESPEREQAGLSAAGGSAQNRGLAWVVGAFVICPCHLPLTLSLGAALFGGTAAGVVLRGHPYVAGAVISAVWLTATWHGFRLMASAERARQR